MGEKIEIGLTMSDDKISITSHRGLWATNEVVHLLKRTMFGAKLSDVKYFKTKTLEEAINILLEPDTFSPSLPLNDYDQFGLSGVAFGTTWVNAPYNTDDDGYRMLSFRKWSIGIFINQDRSIREKLVLFWHNHFATQTNIGHSELVWDHHVKLRQLALGNFKTLLKQITIDPHMLRYLNGDQNTSSAPNENYARELQELFCIGKDSKPGYTEEDVKQVAKILTGWKVDYINRRSYFKPDEHDGSDKKFSTFYKNTVIKGRTGKNAGEEELDDLINMLLTNEETALFICRKLYRWFVYYTIDEKTEREVIKPLATTFKKNNFEIKAVLKELFTSQHFFDEKNKGGMVKSPLDYCIGMYREMEVKSAPQENFVANYSMYNFLIDFCAEMGQIYGDPPNVAGWPAYYQVPGYYRLWINSSTYPKRNEFGNIVVRYGYNREGYFFIADILQLVTGLEDPSNPDMLIEQLLELVYRIPIGNLSKQELKKSKLLSGQSQDHYWTEAWRDYINNTADEIKKNIVVTRLQNLFSFIVNSPEYQLA